LGTGRNSIFALRLAANSVEHHHVLVRIHLATSAFQVVMCREKAVMQILMLSIVSLLRKP
jgi:hypothetical protein